MAASLQSTDCFRHADDLEINEVPDGYVVYQPAIERVHFLNPTAAFVFEMCNGAYSVAEVETVFRSTFDLTSADDVVRACIESLIAEGLVRS